MRKGWIVVAAVVAWCGTSAQVGFAAGSGVWIASYLAHIVSGSEDNTWSVDHQSTGGCDYPATGNGSDMSTFSQGASVPTTFVGSGASAFTFQLPPLATELNETRSDEVQLQNAPDPDCAAPQQPSYSCEPKSTPDMLTFELSVQTEISSSAEELYGSECPPGGVDPPDFPSPMMFSPPLLGPTAPATELVKFTGEEQSDSGGPDGDGMTDTHAELLVGLDRVVVTDPMTMAPLDAVSVTASGDTTVPVQCPSGTCSGTASVIVPETKNLAADGSMFEATAAKAPTFPQAVSQTIGALASGHFHLRAHQRGVKLSWVGGRQVADALASRHMKLDLVIEEKAGGHTVDYIPGQIRLRG